jgi:hypothetical protein
MAFVPVRVEWRRGDNGDAGTYVFFPKPEIRRPSPGKRTAVITVPLMDGVVVQNLSLNERAIELTGVLFNKTNSWDDMETSRQNLVNGIGTGPGQLHLISVQRHIYYKGQMTVEGIQFETQERSNYQQYKINVQVADAIEHNIIVTSKTIQSGAEIT